jgi:hypothetical protein
VNGATANELLEAALGIVEGQLGELVAERQRVQSEFAAKLAPLEQEIARLETVRSHQQHALNALGSNAGVAKATKGSAPNGFLSEAPRKLTDVAEVILRETGKPVHYKHIADEVMKRGVFISARDPGAFIISYLRREPERFCRTAVAGEYALVEWDLEDAKSMQTSNRSIKKRRKTTGAGRKR